MNIAFQPVHGMAWTVQYSMYVLCMTHAQWQLEILSKSYIHMITTRQSGCNTLTRIPLLFFFLPLLDSLGWVHQ